MDRGWIKIYRSLLDWEWFDDAETVQLFIYLLVTANYEDKKWRGMDIKRGQTVIGLEAIAKRLGSTVQKIRTRLEKMTETGTITKEATNKFTIVTICNYESYQDGEEPLQQSNNNQITNRLPEFQQTNNTQNNTQITNKKRSQLTDREEKNRCDDIRDNTQITNKIFGIQHSNNKQIARISTTPKEDKKIRSLSKEEVANATSKKRAAKKGKGQNGEDLKPTDTHQKPTEATTETLEGGVDKSYQEEKNTPQSANLEPSGADEAKSIDYEAIKSKWNEETGGALGKLMMITGRRREMVRARIRETSVDDFFTMIHNAAASSFLRGESQRGWVANFDWCIKPNNYPKVLEGRYNDNSEGEGVILPPNAKRVTDSSEGVDYRYIDFRELDKLHRR